MHDQVLENVDQNLYLGVQFTNTLKWDTHIPHFGQFGQIAWPPEAIPVSVATVPTHRQYGAQALLTYSTLGLTIT
jgi:hypothetical protein